MFSQDRAFVRRGARRNTAVSYEPGEDIYGSPEHRAFRETVRRFVQTELVPRAREFDKMGRIDKSLYRKMGELGLLGIRYDPKYGGLGLDYSYHAIFLEEIAQCDNAGVAMGISVQTDMATPALHRFGSEELKQKYLVPAIRGEMVAAIAVTEPGAGSDVARIQTRAVRDGDYWVINGSKMYITNAATADWLCLLAVTDPDAGYNGFTQIIVPTDTPGFSYKLLDKIGNIGSDTGLLFFDDVRVPITNTIGDPHRGFQQQMMQFQDERMVPVVMAPVQARQLWEITLQHCQQRIVFGKPLSKHQVNQHKFVDMLIQITAAQELAYRCIRLMMRGVDATRDISMAKVFNSNMLQYVATTCVQLFGGAGYCWENPAARAFVDSRLLTIGGGADEVMKQIVAKLLQI
jgi:citronellyl-CoA dehydrogenase